MSEDSSSDDRRFDPSAKRKKEFRDEGRIAVSRDLASAVQLIGVVVAFLMAGNSLLAGMVGAFRWVFAHIGDPDGSIVLSDAIGAEISSIVAPTGILAGVLIVVTLVAYFMQTGFSVNASLIGFKLDRLNPAGRLGELFGPRQAGMRVLLTLAKLGFAAFAVTSVLRTAMPRVNTLALGNFESIGPMLGSEIWHVVIVVIAVLGTVAALDFIWQRRRMLAQMKMTRDEVQREMQEEDGRPQIKQRRRQKHRELSAHRLIIEVPKADVVLTNPTHLAVALRYRAGENRAPIVVAKGADEYAAQIRTIARQHAIPIMEHRALARALYSSVKVGKPIPSTLFQAVAEVLARVYRARRK